MEKETWGWYNLKYDLAELIIPKLAAYKKGYIKEGMCIPDWLLEEKKESYSDEEIKELKNQWIAELDKMIIGFQQISNYNLTENGNLEYDEKAIQIGLDSFAKYFEHFWD